MTMLSTSNHSGSESTSRPSMSKNTACKPLCLSGGPLRRSEGTPGPPMVRNPPRLRATSLAAASAAAPCAMARFLVDPHPRVEHGVQDVDDQVRDDHAGRRDDDDADDQRQVLVVDRVHRL